MLKAYSSEYATDAWTMEHLPKMEALAQKAADDIIDDAASCQDSLCSQDLCDLKNACMILQSCKTMRKMITSTHSGYACSQKAASKATSSHNHGAACSA